MTNSSGKPGPIVLFGSGETSPSGRKIFDHLFRRLPKNPRVSLLETPAGFELNSTMVVSRIADFLRLHLQNHNPRIDLIPARKHGTPFSPDDDQIAAPLLQSDLIFAGPGSPSYAVRQLRNSLTWHYMLARNRLGAALVFSSAAVIAFSSLALPVYEIYKVGEDPHWKSGLDFFAHYGIPLIFIPHWNNNDGGVELDTSRCFMGKERFESMLAMLPEEQIIIGIDEHTALWLDCADQCCEVMGFGNVTIFKNNDQREISHGGTFKFKDIMDCQILDPPDGIPLDVWEVAQNAALVGTQDDPLPPQVILDLVELRQLARDRKDWTASDTLRDQILSSGWHLNDTPDGPEIYKR